MEEDEVNCEGLSMKLTKQITALPPYGQDNQWQAKNCSVVLSILKATLNFNL
jgi:hypothetical protein